MRKSTSVTVAVMATLMGLNPLVGAARVGAMPDAGDSLAAIEAGVSDVAGEPLPSTITESGLEAHSDGIEVSLASNPGEGVAVAAGDAPEVAVGVPLAGAATDATFVNGSAVYVLAEHDAAVTARPVAGGAQVVVTLASSDAPSTYRFPVSSPDTDVELFDAPDGGVIVMDSAASVELGIVVPPWAVDANGRDLPTDFAIEGDTIVQTVDLDGAAFPVQVDPGYYGTGMTQAEASWCKWPSRFALCSKAKGHADAALARAQQIYPASLHNGKGDAFRHCYWSARMTIDFGSDTAKGFGDRHEDNDGPAKERSMDLANNATGRSVGRGTNSYSTASSRCHDKAAKRELVTL